jgi:hypothetical protein
VDEADVEKRGNGYVLRGDPSVRVSSRAHKMSKSRGNVVNPDDVVTMYGADSLRLYEMFMGPLRDTKVSQGAILAWVPADMSILDRHCIPGTGCSREAQRRRLFI